LNKQDGNPLPRFINKIDIGRNYCHGSINSEGLPNAGIDYCKLILLLLFIIIIIIDSCCMNHIIFYNVTIMFCATFLAIYLSMKLLLTNIILDISEEATKTLASYGKPYIISISGLNLNDNLEMLTKIYSSSSSSSSSSSINNNNIAAIELNLACPNIIGKPIIAYDFEQLEIVLEQVTSLSNYHNIPCGIKLPPYFDISHYEKMINIIIKYPIKYIVTMNTIGNALYVNIDDECEGIMPNHGRGGLGGGFVKYIALANVNIIYKLLKEKGRDDIDIVGVGGVRSGKSLFMSIYYIIFYFLCSVLLFIYGSLRFDFYLCIHITYTYLYKFIS